MPSSKSTILIVDDDPAIRMALATKLAQSGHKTLEAAGVAAAVRLKRQHFDLAVLDYQLPDGSGAELLKDIKADHPEVPVIILTGYADVAGAVAAMKRGAYHYASKPIELDELCQVVERALESSRLRREVRALQVERSLSRDEGLLVGNSPQMEECRELLSRIAVSPGSTVLVTGESGTGKDLVARAIHAQSERRKGPFLNITCSALPSALLESELFGHEKGAFTDAKQRKIGLLEHANGGTVFLDEIGEMDLGLQAKVLRFLEDKTFRRVGGNSEVQADIRFVAATNVDLRKATRDQTFREDLYYRLAVLMIGLPPLRDREGDAELLAAHFVDRFGREFGRRECRLSSEALELIRTYPWPGNVRELKNAMERAVLLGGDILMRSDFEMLGSTSVGAGGFDLPAGGINMRDLERKMVEQALERTGGNRTQAAKLLGMHRDQVRYRIDLYGLKK